MHSGIRFRRTAIGWSCLLFTLASPATTLAGISPPTLVVERLTETTPTSVTFNLEVIRNGAPVGVSVEYGTDTSYGTIVGTVDDPEATDGTLVVSIPIINLTPGTVYHYRVIAGNSAGQVMTEDRTLPVILCPAPVSPDRLCPRARSLSRLDFPRSMITSRWHFRRASFRGGYPRAM
jgi:hypothetical protein